MSLTLPAPRIDPRVRRTKKAIETAFLALVSEQGFSQVTVQDITERAEINRATFYIHYRDKDDLFRNLVSENFDFILDQRLTPDSVLSPEALKGLLEIVFGFLAKTYEGCEAHDDNMQAQLEVQIRNKIETILQGWLGKQRQSAGAPLMEADHVASMLAWMIFGSAIRWQQMQNPPPLEQMLKRTMNFIRGGLSYCGYWIA